MIAASVSGRVGQDAKIRTAGDSNVLGFSIASSGYRSGEKTTDWVSVSMFGKRGEKIAQYVTKGSYVVARGNLYARTHEGKTYLELIADDVELGPKQSATDDAF